MSQRPTDAQIASWPFVKDLSREQTDRLRREVVVRRFDGGALLCRQGQPADYWIGVADGAVNVEVATPDGRSTTLASMTRGCWFGEGSVIKHGGWPFDAVALGPVEAVLMPTAVFHRLLDASLAFNRFVIDQLNARLGQFIERCMLDRLCDAGQRTAHCIAEFVDPALYPGGVDRIPLSQEELARLAGVSRQVVNRTLHDLAREGLLSVSYGGVTLLDRAALRRFGTAPPAAAGRPRPAGTPS
jgi:CRP-like cAMP-binding protein